MDRKPVEVDQGGPATVYALDQAFDLDVTLRNLTVDFGGGAAHGGRSITYEDSELRGNFWPSVAEEIVVRDSTIAASPRSASFWTT